MKNTNCISKQSHEEAATPSFFMLVPPQITVFAECHPNHYIMSALNGEPPPHPILPHFQLEHPVVAPPSGMDIKLNLGAQLQTFPYPRN